MDFFQAIVIACALTFNGVPDPSTCFPVIHDDIAIFKSKDNCKIRTQQLKRELSDKDSETYKLYVKNFNTVMGVPSAVLPPHVSLFICEKVETL